MRRKIAKDEYKNVFLKMKKDNLSMSQVAQQYGVTQSTISRGIKYYSMEAWADYIKTNGDYAWLLSQDKYKMPIETFNELLQKGYQYLGPAEKYV